MSMTEEEIIKSFKEGLNVDIVEEQLEYYWIRVYTKEEYELTKGDIIHSMRGLEFFVDCANGAAFQAAPALFEKVGATVGVIATEPNGMNINDGVGAMHPEAVAKAANGHIGLAFDGDADRLIAVDEDGVAVNGDVIMAIFANWQHERGKLKNDIVVATDRKSVV